MSKRLSKRESAVLATIAADMPNGSTGDDLVRGVRAWLGSISPQDVTPAGVHQTAASLVRKDLAWRAGTSKLQCYKITQAGRQALAGDGGGQWTAQ